MPLYFTSLARFTESSNNESSTQTEQEGRGWTALASYGLLCQLTLSKTLREMPKVSPMVAEEEEEAN